MIRFYLNLRRRFYDGPAVFNHPCRQERYQSPTYWWARAIGHWWFTPCGRLFVIMTGVLVMGGMMSVLMPMYFLSFLLTSIFLCDLVLGWFVRPRLDIQRLTPSSGPAGKLLRVDYRVRNLRPRPAWDLAVDVMPPVGLRFPDGPPVIRELEAGKEAILSTHVVAPARGKYLLPLPVVSSSFPFGLFRWSCLGPGTPPLLIYPNYTPLQEMQFPAGVDCQPGGPVQAATASDSIEFLGCREYRYGDSPRHLHARSSARLGKPVIKQFREEYLSRVGLVVDVCTPSGRDWRRWLRPGPPFEATLSLTAAIAEHLARRNYQIDLLVPGAGVHYDGSGMPGQLQGVLESLAPLQEHRGAFVVLPPEARHEVRMIGACLLVLQEWDDVRAGQVRELQQLGVAVKVVVVTVRTDCRVPDDPDFCVVTPAAVLAGQVTHL